jgi:hypothetical protein
MDGRFQVSDSLGDTVSQYPSDTIVARMRDWIENSLHRVDVRHPQSMHLDELLGSRLHDVDQLNLALTAFRYLIDELARVSMPVQPAIAIPLLGESTVIQAAVPRSMDEVRRQWRSVEPPRLYMLDLSLYSHPLIRESYTTPLPFHLFTPAIDGVYAFYEESREALGMRAGWEFARTVSARYFPLSLRTYVEPWPE